MAIITIQPSGRTVECASGDTVLTALERAGYALPNNCRAGACGECKVKVLAGSFDQGTVLDMALTADERAQGYGLMCMAKPLEGSLEIEWGAADARPKLFPPRENALFVVTDKRPLTPRVAELRLRPLGKPLRYWPGQYVMLGDPGAGIAPRAYSISNAPRPDGELVLQIARMEGGATSSWVHGALMPGDSVKLSGPYGTFIGDPAVDAPVLCLAAGTGLAPILALTEAAMRRGFRQPVMLVISARTRADVYGLGMLAWWRAKHRKFDYRIALTREAGGDGLSGRIGEVLPAIFADLSRHTVFAAGSPGFVASSVEAALRQGATPEAIFTEGFNARQRPTVVDDEHLLPGAEAS
ncbi:MAG: 2Fe-2S iron-sulfur cluster-binding protein [Achromobacter sp.]|uniref:2Fe-2S iron-sulfur cluster-binding protein n=1 Tax=Achromobacter sp. TaxID=134375 RepID=UPI003D085383